jgi:hypothetical protein
LPKDILVTDLPGSGLSRELFCGPGRYQELDLFIKVLRLLCPNLTDASSKDKSHFDAEFITFHAPAWVFFVFYSLALAFSIFSFLGGEEEKRKDKKNENT